MDDCRIEAAAKYPDNIAEQTQAAAVTAIAHYFFTKGKKYQLYEFETLQAPWNANDRGAKNKASEKISQCCKKTAEYQPYQVAQ
jgi:hypothetical protein